MRKLILQMQYSLDGMVAGPNGELDWIFPDFDDGYARWTRFPRSFSRAA
jgi:hypothetical protein